MLHIDGSYLEGGGQILRTSLALAIVLDREIEISGIRKKRKNPGLAEQHLCAIGAFEKIFTSRCEDAFLGSDRITFYPSRQLKSSSVQIHPRTSSSIGLILQAVLPALYFVRKPITLEIQGGTAGKWAPPVDFYPFVLFPILGIAAQVRICQRGYYPKGGGLVEIDFKEFKPKRLDLVERGVLQKIKIMSFASRKLAQASVAERQAEAAMAVLKKEIQERIEFESEAQYVDTLSVGSEINLCVYFSASRLWSDALGERGKPAEAVGKEAAEKLLVEIRSAGACDSHLTDMLIPYLAICGGCMKASRVSNHALTNLWVCEQFFGKIFRVEGNSIEARGQADEFR